MPWLSLLNVLLLRGPPRAQLAPRFGEQEKKSKSVRSKGIWQSSAMISLASSREGGKKGGGVCFFGVDSQLAGRIKNMRTQFWMIV